MNNRIQWIDNAKALGIFLVFWGHLIERGAFTGQSMLVHDVYKAIYAFHMPLFFILAGCFFRSRDIRFGTLLVQKFKSRLVPVGLFVVLGSLCWQVPTWWGLTIDAAVPSQALEQNWLLLQGKPVNNWPCWFLVCLFVVELLASELIPVLTNGLRLVIGIVAMAGIAALAVSSPVPTANFMGFMEKDWWFWQEAPVALCFYLIGYYLFHYLATVLPAKTKLSHAVFAISLVLFLLLYNRDFADGLGTVNMSGASYSNWWIFWPAAVSGSIALMHIASYVPDIQLLKYIGANTIPLLGINGLMLNFLNQHVWAICEPYIAGPAIIPVSLVAAAGSLLLCLPFVFLLNKLVPLLIGHWK